MNNIWLYYIFLQTSNLHYIPLSFNFFNVSVFLIMWSNILKGSNYHSDFLCISKPIWECWNWVWEMFCCSLEWVNTGEWGVWPRNKHQQLHIGVSWWSVLSQITYLRMFEYWVWEMFCCSTQGEEGKITCLYGNVYFFYVVLCSHSLG